VWPFKAAFNLLQWSKEISLRSRPPFKKTHHSQVGLSPGRISSLDPTECAEHKATVQRQVEASEVLSRKSMHPRSAILHPFSLCGKGGHPARQTRSLSSSALEQSQSPLQFSRSTSPPTLQVVITDKCIGPFPSQPRISGQQPKPLAVVLKFGTLGRQTRFPLGFFHKRPSTQP